MEEAAAELRRSYFPAPLRFREGLFPAGCPTFVEGSAECLCDSERYAPRPKSLTERNGLGMLRPFTENTQRPRCYWMPILWSNWVKRGSERNGSARGSTPR